MFPSQDGARGVTSGPWTEPTREGQSQPAQCSRQGELGQGWESCLRRLCKWGGGQDILSPVLRNEGRGLAQLGRRRATVGFRPWASHLTQHAPLSSPWGQVLQVSEVG